MFITYSPAEGDVQRWDFNPSKLRSLEAEMIEKRYGDNFDNFRSALIAGSVKARRVALWHLLSRRHPTLKFEDVDFALGEVEVSFSRSELLNIRDSMERSFPFESDAERAAMLAAMNEQIAEAPDEDDAGKAPANGDA